MALSATTQVANRYGLDVQFYAYTSTTEPVPSTTVTPDLTVDFLNVSDVSLSGDRVWATGGIYHANKIGFNNPMEGTLTLSTQIMTNQLLAIAANQSIPTGVSAIDFENNTNSAPKYFLIVANTIWQDAAGVVYTETLTFHKASAQRAFNISYTGEGDPMSMDIVFDLLENADHKILTVERADQTTSGGGGGSGT